MSCGPVIVVVMNTGSMPVQQLLVNLRIRHLPQDREPSGSETSVVRDRRRLAGAYPNGEPEGNSATLRRFPSLSLNQAALTKPASMTPSVTVAPGGGG